MILQLDEDPLKILQLRLCYPMNSFWLCPLMFGLLRLDYLEKNKRRRFNFIYLKENKNMDFSKCIFQPFYNFINFWNFKINYYFSSLHFCLNTQLVKV